MVFNPNAGPKLKTPEDSFQEDLRNKVKAVIYRYPNHKKLGPEFKAKVENIILGKTEGKEKQDKIKLNFNEYHEDIRITGKNGSKKDITITEGEMIAALEWGIEFDLDKASFASNKVPEAKKIYENYIIALRERKALDLLNEHILNYEIEHATGGDIDSYKETLRTEEKPFLERSHGIQAEQMVTALLKQISIDNPKLNFVVVSTNHYEDVERGIDFIVQIVHTNQETGVKTVEAGPGVEKVEFKKIQFTISKSTDTVEGKKDKSEKSKNSLVVAMPGLQIKNAIKEWVESGAKTSGPEKYFNQETKNAIVAEIQKALIEQSS